MKACHFDLTQKNICEIIQRKIFKSVLLLCRALRLPLLEFLLLSSHFSCYIAANFFASKTQGKDYNSATTLQFLQELVMMVILRSTNLDRR